MHRWEAVLHRGGMGQRQGAVGRKTGRGDGKLLGEREGAGFRFLQARLLQLGRGQGAIYSPLYLDPGRACKNREERQPFLYKGQVPRAGNCLQRPPGNLSAVHCKRQGADSI